MISKLESFQQKLVGLDLIDLAIELQNIIEEAKKKEPDAWKHESRNESDVITSEVKSLWLGVNPSKVSKYTIPLFPHPHLSDETVKDGYVLVPIEPTEEMEYEGNQKADTIGMHINFGEYNHDLGMAKEVYKAMIAEAMKAEDAKEATKG